MSLPPSDIEPSELLAKLMERPEPSEIFELPGTDRYGNPLGRVRLRVLRMAEHDECRIRARRWLRERKLPQEDLSSYTIQEVESDAVAREILAVACVSEHAAPGTNTHRRIFRNAKDVSDFLSADEVALLFGAWALTQRKWGPHERNLMSDEEVSAWITRLREAASASPLLLLESHQRDELMLLLAGRAYTLSQILQCPVESLPKFLESVPKSYCTPISYSTEHAATTPTQSEDLITAEQAMELARSMHKNS